MQETLRLRPLNWIILGLLLGTTMLQFSTPILARGAQTLVAPLGGLIADFSWTPRFVLIGNGVTFTGSPIGGTPPYSFAWDFGDSQTGTGNMVFHMYATVGNYTVVLTVTDSGTPTPQTVIVSHIVTVQPWPIIRDGWVVRWNVTGSDGMNIWDVTYNGVLVIRDARVPAIYVKYLYNFCGPFYDEMLRGYLNVNAGNVFYENSPSPSNPYFQIRAKYDVPGYFYQQLWRFYPNGRWDAELWTAHGGCSLDHIYEARWLIDLAITDDANDMLSVYTRRGVWQNLLWEGNYTDNGARDMGHNASQWRFGDSGKYYYIVPTIIRSDLDLPDIQSKVFLVRAKPFEIEAPPDRTNFLQFVNKGELAYRRNLAFWWIAEYWDHGVPSGQASNITTLSFYPQGL